VKYHREGLKMLFMFKARVEKPADVSNQEFYTVWSKEAEAALEAVRSGAIKGIYKASGQPVVIVIMDVPTADDLDRALHELPMWKLGYAHIIKDIEVIALRPYENWAEDLKKLAEG
jgi:muconolactone delta-isomerase